jgi:hypothetical protein|tara:strand:+ start:2319 stop:2495 length:177 start_codon:yes stop_codon:yes gene_type:complete
MKERKQLEQELGSLLKGPGMVHHQPGKDKVDALAKYMPELFDPPPVKQLETLINSIKK